MIENYNIHVVDFWFRPTNYYFSQIINVLQLKKKTFFCRQYMLLLEVQKFNSKS